MNLDKIKADLLHKAQVDGLVKEMDGKKVTPSMQDIPVKRMIDQVNYMDKELLPTIKKKKGENSADYEFFSEVIRSLLYAIVAVDRWERVELRYVNQLIQLQLCKEHLAILELELRKYQAMEDLYLRPGFNVYHDRVVKHAEDLLKGTTKPK